MKFALPFVEHVDRAGFGAGELHSLGYDGREDGFKIERGIHCLGHFTKRSSSSTERPSSSVRCRSASKNHLSEQVRTYLRHAEQCGQRAKIEPDPNLAREYLDMEQRWLKLARRYQFSESLEAFSKQNKKRQDEATGRATMITRREP
jgi:hypothetical protein